MDYQELQKYNVVSVQSYCCTEAPRISAVLPKLLPGHTVQLIKNPITRIDFKGNVRMGLVEAKLHGVICEIERGIKSNAKYCTNIIPLLNIAWIQQFKPVSPYLIREATDLFKRTNLVVVPLREDVIGRNGEPEWFTKSKDARTAEQSKESILAELVYTNSIDCRSLNKLLQIAQTRGLWNRGKIKIKIKTKTKIKPKVWPAVPAICSDMKDLVEIHGIETLTEK